MRGFGTFVIVKPHSSLKLIPGVQEQDIFFLPAYLRHFREPPGDPREARTLAGTFPRVLAGLLDPRVVVVGVEQSQLERRRRDRQ